MARPWIEFIQSQCLPWTASDLGGARAGVEVKRLSRDDETGACSVVMRLPAGWRSPAGALACDEEFLVIGGALTIGGEAYTDKFYAHLPAGHETGEWESAEGAVLLAFYSAEPARGAAAAYDPARLVARCDAFRVPYTGNFHPEFPPGAGRKVLYEDPITGAQSWILGTLPMRWAERAEVHPIIEEAYVLAGEAQGNRGVMRPGAYFWRPPHKVHGPYGTLTGNLYFMRTQGGRLKTDYVDVARPFAWGPAYDPVLPDELRELAHETPDAPRPW